MKSTFNNKNKIYIILVKFTGIQCYTENWLKSGKFFEISQNHVHGRIRQIYEM